jgi:hypothetical protein
MTGIQHVYLAYGAALVLLGGYALLLWSSLWKAQRSRNRQ